MVGTGDALTEQEFRGAVRAAFDRITERLVPVLKQIVEHEYPKKVAEISFELFPDFRQGFPIRAFFLDDDNNEFFVFVDGEAEYPSPVDPGLIEVDRVYDRAIEDEYLAANPNEYGAESCYEIAAEEMIPWFAACWSAAGGDSFARKATIALHDDLKYFDLCAKKLFEVRFEA